MSFVTDSPVHSSSSDDFAALLDAELEVGSSGSSHNEQDDEEEEVDDDNNDDDDDLDNQRNKRCKTEKLEDVEEPQGSTSQGLIEENIGKVP
ncbi:RNA polymerase II C-terminal domain phosphatase-like 4 isoform X2 [Durio zibethinus]|nr:RNA polymerase II C-terminal domain phosphatase-like 4 isoform X2 [Durio zibethinus]XP_022754123.1 RNA polymerase II C-terminal domain phosphatase-like 4 isoform X2 [Durio zibethinus]